MTVDDPCIDSLNFYPYDRYSPINVAKSFTIIIGRIIAFEVPQIHQHPEYSIYLRVIRDHFQVTKTPVTSNY